MKTKFLKFRGAIITLIFSVLIISIFFHNVITGANKTLLNDRYDAFKNYYTVMWHVKHDSSYFNFQGMNYPYGEYLPYVDSQPIFSNGLKLIHKKGGFIDDHIIGIMNILMLLSVPFCSLLIFFILKQLNVQELTAIVGSIGISLLSSQILLWEKGHFGLSFSFSFPLCWYLILQYKQKNNKWLFSLLICLNTILWFFVHAYLGFINLAFSFLVMSMTHSIFINQKTGLLWIRDLIIQIIIPISIILLIFSLDNHEGRIIMPYTLHYRANLFTTLYPNHSFVKSFFEWINIIPETTTRWAMIGNYIGVTSIIGLSTFFVVELKSLITKQKHAVPSDLSVSLIASGILCLFSFGIVFNKYLISFIPKLAQFVAIGRFSWPFYFIAGTFSIYYLDTLFSKKYRWITILLSFILIFEGIGNLTHLKQSLAFADNFFTKKIITPAESEFYNEKYQAILPIPYFHKYITPGNFKGTNASVNTSMILSIQTGLPLLGAFLSRPSVSEGKKLVQLFSPPEIPKEILKDVKSSRPVLVMYTNEKIDEREKNILNHSNLIKTYDSFSLYELDLQDLEQKKCAKTDKQLTEQELTKVEQLTYNKIYFESFDSLSTDIVFSGRGALEAKKTELNFIFSSSDIKFDTSQLFEISFWYYNNLYDQSFTTMWLEEKDTAGIIVNSHYFNPIQTGITLNNWVLNRLVFDVKNTDNKIYLLSKGEDYFSDRIYFDNLLIRPVNQNYLDYFINDSDTIALIRNNLPCFYE